MIKFDLHIHSIASKYKEAANIVDDSTKENVDTLLAKLEEHQVALFSITDHNRFNVELYKKIDEILNNPNCEYKSVKNVLSGVEFDVKIDDEMGRCHIITIFDSKNNLKNYEKINSEIENKKLDNKNDYYKKEEFEQLLKNIGLNTILIASQRKNIHNHNGGHNSLSDSSKRVGEIISVGYINALEYQKPKVEGILKNNLKKLPTPVSLVTGSDCHKWSSYPYHDDINKNNDFHHSSAKIMPTFKGLLMAITSPKTRFNCRENNNPLYIEGFNTKKGNIPLRNGINAIIGENGSGKSTLLKFITDDTKEPFVGKIIRKNKLEKENRIESTKIKYIGQGDIITSFNNNTLFDSTESNFNEIDHSNFIDEYKLFESLLKGRVNKNIKKKDAIQLLEKKVIQYKPELEVNNYFVHLNSKQGFDEIKNIHDDPLNKIKKLINDLRDLKAKSYYNDFLDDINDAESTLLSIYKKIRNKWKLVNSEANIKNAIESSITKYNLTVDENSSTRDKQKKEYTKKRQNLVDAVMNAVQLNSDKITHVVEPEIKEGNSKNRKRGFCFNREANYNNVSMLNIFLSRMFNKGYHKLEKILQIDNSFEFVSAIRNCTSKEDIDVKWRENFNKFIENVTQVKEYITDGPNKQIGNTLGEMSLSYYKYYTQDRDEWNILIIDQPEDNISNNNISKNLIKYFNSIRYNKQLILVTHNPLLVVNLDVDNVIYIKNNGGNLSFKNGCLEYEDKNTNILELIAKNMDGGKESIEKRLKVYGK